jgi:hypothetical protein
LTILIISEGFFELSMGTVEINPQNFPITHFSPLPSLPRTVGPLHLMAFPMALLPQPSTSIAPSQRFRSSTIIIAAPSRCSVPRAVCSSISSNNALIVSFPFYICVTAQRKTISNPTLQYIEPLSC